jgi:AcrR family transcriptional regulator
VSDPSAARPRRGRQAEAERNDRALLEAAREVLASRGPEAPVSAIAERAGIGMGSLYRRYRSKEELLQRLCLLAMDHAIEAAEAGLAADDTWEGFAGYVERCVTFGSGALAPLAGTIATTREMRERNRRSRDLLGALVERAKRDGGLRSDVDALDVVWLIEHFSRSRPSRPTVESENVRQRLLAIALDGLRSAGARPLPGTPPDRRYYEDRWTHGRREC